MPDNGNEWKKFRVVPRSNPLRPLVSTLFNRGGNGRAFRLLGEGGDHFHCAVGLSSGVLQAGLGRTVSVCPASICFWAHPSGPMGKHGKGGWCVGACPLCLE